jgi:ubiquinone/menaquinone biosynthesis C-methylase UbiE
MARKIMALSIKNGDCVIDCTVGNGYDTLFLAKNVGLKGKVYGFDIQDTAIKSTKEKLIKENLYDRVILINDGHENLQKYVQEKVKLVVFNLGYLPNGDHNITTKPSTTLEGIKSSLNVLNDNGIILITSYTGHKGGIEEKDAIEEFLKELNQKKFNVLRFDFINQVNNPPILYGVEKL